MNCYWLKRTVCALMIFHIEEKFDVRMDRHVDKFLGIVCNIKENEVVIHSASAVERTLH